MGQPAEEDLDRLLGQIEAAGPLDPARIPVQPRDCGRVREQLAPALSYFGVVENEAAALNTKEVRALLAGGLDPRTDRFIDAWAAQEAVHGKLFDAMQRQVGLEPLPPLLEVILTYKVAGALGNLLPGLQPVLMALYLTTGAMHEALTAQGYRHMRAKLERLEETELAQGMIGPIASQEGPHFNYYYASALRLRSRLSAWQLAAASLIKRHTYRPVGASSTARMREFGAVISSLIPEPNELESVGQAVYRVAKGLLALKEQGLPMGSFVTRSLKECAALSGK